MLTNLTLDLVHFFGHYTTEKCNSKCLLCLEPGNVKRVPNIWARGKASLQSEFFVKITGNMQRSGYCWTWLPETFAACALMPRNVPANTSRQCSLECLLRLDRNWWRDLPAGERNGLFPCCLWARAPVNRFCSIFCSISLLNHDNNFAVKSGSACEGWVCSECVTLPIALHIGILFQYQLRGSGQSPQNRRASSWKSTGSKNFGVPEKPKKFGSNWLFCACWPK